MFVLSILWIRDYGTRYYGDMDTVIGYRRLRLDLSMHVQRASVRYQKAFSLYDCALLYNSQFFWSSVYT